MKFTSDHGLKKGDRFVWHGGEGGGTIDGINSSCVGQTMQVTKTGAHVTAECRHCRNVWYFRYFIGHQFTPINTFDELASISTPAFDSLKESPMFTVTTVETINGHVGQVWATTPGRRSIVWESEAFPTGEIVSTQEAGPVAEGVTKAHQAGQARVDQVLKEMFA